MEGLTNPGVQFAVSTLDVITFRFRLTVSTPGAKRNEIISGPPPWFCGSLTVTRALLTLLQGPRATQGSRPTSGATTVNGSHPLGQPPLHPCSTYSKRLHRCAHKCLHFCVPGLVRMRPGKRAHVHGGLGEVSPAPPCEVLATASL